MDFEAVSEVNRYSARPAPSVRKVPMSPLCVVTVAAELDEVPAAAEPLGAATEAEAAGESDAEVPEPPHAAASTPAVAREKRKPALRAGLAEIARRMEASLSVLFGNRRCVTVPTAFPWTRLAAVVGSAT
jgi:hypothetical protein